MWPNTTNLALGPLAWEAENQSLTLGWRKKISIYCTLPRKEPGNYLLFDSGVFLRSWRGAEFLLYWNWGWQAHDQLVPSFLVGQWTCDSPVIGQWASRALREFMMARWGSTWLHSAQTWNFPTQITPGLHWPIDFLICWRSKWPLESGGEEWLARPAGSLP